MLDVRRWAEIRRMKEVERLSIHEIVRRTGHDRNTVRRALRSDGPPRYERSPRSSKLDPFKDEITRLLSPQHRDQCADGCPSAALLDEIAPAPPPPDRSSPTN